MPTRTTETARVPEDISGRQRRMPVGGITWRHTFRALRHRNYRLFFWGQLVSLIGTWMQQTAMSWYVYQITNSKFLLGVVSAVGSDRKSTRLNSSHVAISYAVFCLKK